MITLTIKTPAAKDQPGANDLGLYGWWADSAREFSTIGQAYNFIVDTYKKDAGVLTAWNKPFFIDAVKSNQENGSVSIGGQAESQEAFKLAVLMSKIIRNSKESGRKLKNSELAIMDTQARAFMKKSITYEDGVAERGKRIWQ